MINEKAPGMSLIVRSATRLTVGLIMLYGIYIFCNEETSPGGGFAGGIIIALAFISIMLAYGKDLALMTVPRNLLAFLGSLGVFLLLSVALLVFSGGYFLQEFGIYYHTYLATAMEVSAGIAAIFIVLALLRARRESKP